jgi:glycerate dehydrogenase
MKITILDRNTVTAGDLSLAPIEALGEVRIFDALPHDAVADAIADSDAVIINKARITAEIMDACKNLRFIGLFATGYNNVDTAAARARGIDVCNVPGYSTDSVAQLTISLLLELAGNASTYARSVAAGDWKRSKQFSYFFAPITEIKGKTLGIYGLGTIGQAVAKIALAFGMKVIAYSRTPKNIEGITDVDKETLFRESDFLSFHCPLNPDSALAVNKDTLALMKPTAFLINTARGGVVDEVALAEALENEKIAGAALDVLTDEPMSDTCPLFGAKNCIITPHISWASKGSRQRIMNTTVENVKSFMDGAPANVVNA